MPKSKFTWRIFCKIPSHRREITENVMSPCTSHMQQRKLPLHGQSRRKFFCCSMAFDNPFDSASHSIQICTKLLIRLPEGPNSKTENKKVPSGSNPSNERLSSSLGKFCKREPSVVWALHGKESIFRSLHIIEYICTVPLWEQRHRIPRSVDWLPAGW